MMNINDVLFYGHKTVLGSIENLDEADWTTPGVCGVWSVKDIMAHLASYELMLADVLKSVQGESDTPTLAHMLADYEGFNDEQVWQRKDKTSDEIRAEYNDAYAQVMDLLAHFPEEKIRQKGVLAWYGEGYDLEDFVVYTFYGHKREHTAQIDKFRDSLRAQG